MQEVMDRLAEFQAARDAKLISPAEAARRARQILDHENSQPIDISVFLAEKGYQGPALLCAVGTYGKALKAEYIREHGAPPMRVHQLVGRDLRMVNAYIEADRDLMESVYEEWSR